MNFLILKLQNLPDSTRHFLLITAVMMAAIIQIIDTTIANVALPRMQGSLSVTQDKIAWVLTSYIMATAIAMPLTGWVAGRIGRKRLLIISVSGFTLASMACGASYTLEEMIVFRVLQGIFGASLVPISQSLLLDTFPVQKHARAMGIWGVGVMVAPILGPTAGGWLTEYYSWRWVFYINVPFGILSLLGVIALAKESVLDKERPFDLLGYPVFDAGLILAPRGVGTMIAMLLCSWIMEREVMSARLVIVIGLLLIVATMWGMTGFTVNVTQSTISWTGLVRGFGLGLIFVPLSTLAFATLDPLLRTEATSVFGLVRTIGSSLGISIVVSELASNSQIEHALLTEHITEFNPLLQNTALASVWDIHTPQGMALLESEVA